MSDFWKISIPKSRPICLAEEGKEVLPVKIDFYEFEITCQADGSYLAKCPEIGSTISSKSKERLKILVQEAVDNYEESNIYVR